jgi:hypothetical protein
LPTPSSAMSLCPWRAWLRRRGRRGCPRGGGHRQPSHRAPTPPPPAPSGCFSWVFRVRSVNFLMVMVWAGVLVAQQLTVTTGRMFLYGLVVFGTLHLLTMVLVTVRLMSLWRRVRRRWRWPGALLAPRRACTAAAGPPREDTWPVTSPPPPPLWHAAACRETPSHWTDWTAHTAVLGRSSWATGRAHGRRCCRTSQCAPASWWWSSRWGGGRGCGASKRGGRGGLRVGLLVPCHNVWPFARVSMHCVCGGAGGAAAIQTTLPPPPPLGSPTSRARWSWRVCSMEGMTWRPSKTRAPAAARASPTPSGMTTWWSARASAMWAAQRSAVRTRPPAAHHLGEPGQPGRLAEAS